VGRKEGRTTLLEGTGDQFLADGERKAGEAPKSRVAKEKVGGTNAFKGSVRVDVTVETILA